MSIHHYLRSLTFDSDASATHPPASAGFATLPRTPGRPLLAQLQPGRQLPGRRRSAAVVTGDFNGDGRLDLAVANSSSNSVSILRGNANGTFQAAKNFATGDRPDLRGGRRLQQRRQARPGDRQLRAT